MGGLRVAIRLFHQNRLRPSEVPPAEGIFEFEASRRGKREVGKITGKA